VGGGQRTTKLGKGKKGQTISFLIQAEWLHPFHAVFFYNNFFVSNPRNWLKLNKAKALFWSFIFFTPKFNFICSF